MEDKEKKELLKREGVKYDGGKLRYDLIPADSLEELAKVYTMGAKKYEDHNWRKGMLWSRVFAALMRHSWSWFQGYDKDYESGLHPLAHAAWCCFTLMNYAKTRKEFDDRIKNDGCEESGCNEIRELDMYDQDGNYRGKLFVDPDNIVIDNEILNGITTGKIFLKPV
jgi:hypothetical protein